MAIRAMNAMGNDRISAQANFPAQPELWLDTHEYLSDRIYPAFRPTCCPARYGKTGQGRQREKAGYIEYPGQTIRVFLAQLKDDNSSILDPLRGLSRFHAFTLHRGIHPRIAIQPQASCGPADKYPAFSSRLFLAPSICSSINTLPLRLVSKSGIEHDGSIVLNRQALVDRPWRFSRTDS